MKKILILIIPIFLLTGCVNINEKSIDDVISMASPVENTNNYRSGYKYYLPTNMNVLKTSKVNEVLSDGKNNYYLYLDLISYYNKIDLNYEKDDNLYYYKELNINNIKGFLKISVKSDKYLIEIIYNYAKIEVMVDKEDINETIANSLIILSSIKYNNDIIANMMGEDILSYSEEKLTIFDSEITDNSNFLEYVQNDSYNDNNEIPDYDLIN